METSETPPTGGGVKIRGMFAGDDDETTIVIGGQRPRTKAAERSGGRAAGDTVRSGTADSGQMQSAPTSGVGGMLQRAKEAVLGGGETPKAGRDATAKDALGARPRIVAPVDRIRNLSPQEIYDKLHDDFQQFPTVIDWDSTANTDPAKAKAISKWGGEEGAKSAVTLYVDTCKEHTELERGEAVVDDFTHINFDAAKAKIIELTLDQIMALSERQKLDLLGTFFKEFRDKEKKNGQT